MLLNTTFEASAGEDKDSAVVESVEVNPTVVVDPLFVVDTAAEVEPAAVVETAESVGLVPEVDTSETVGKEDEVVTADAVEPTDPPPPKEPTSFSQMYDFARSHLESSHVSVLSILTQS